MELSLRRLPFLASFSFSLFFFQSMAAAKLFDFALPPIVSPIIDKVCDGVECGKGNCKVYINETFGFVCECQQGWTQFHVGDHLRFMPCVIPDCNVDFSCQHASPPAIPSPPPQNSSIFNPCTWSYCGEGTCMKTSTFGHKCQCQTGYANLLNSTNFPCFRECSLGADCTNLGIGPTNRSSSTAPPTLSDSGNTENQANLGLPENLLGLISLMISLLMVPWL